ncbi:class I SAM-dependent methyltransferase [Deinococcus metalli]|uniref:class I SAM-dependent methyltransferase n=1 Tax=Deinococcus metalli TaxID=1141878 RepID=UPI00161BFEE0
MNALLPTALDVACGTGNPTAALRQLANAITGTDVFPAMLKQAQARFPDLTFVEAPAEHLPFGPSSFDLQRL